jgi:hypothetical protein
MDVAVDVGPGQNKDDTPPRISRAICKYALRALASVERNEAARVFAGKLRGNAAWAPKRAEDVRVAPSRYGVASARAARGR